MRRLPGEEFDVEVNREKSKSVGVTFRTGGHDGEVVVASVTADSPAGQTELKKVAFMEMSSFKACFDCLDKMNTVSFDWFTVFIHA